MNRYLHRVAYVLTGLLFLAAGLAQPEVSGSIAGTIDGAERSWNTYANTAGDQILNSASWLVPFEGILSFTITGQTQPTVMGITKGGVMIVAESVGEVGPCPCTFDFAQIFYFTTDSFGLEFYFGSEVEVTFETFERLDEDTFEVGGSFTGELAFNADYSSGSDPENTVTVEGTFEIERMSREPGGE